MFLAYYQSLFYTHIQSHSLCLSLYLSFPLSLSFSLSHTLFLIHSLFHFYLTPVNYFILVSVIHAINSYLQSDHFIFAFAGLIYHSHNRSSRPIPITSFFHFCWFFFASYACPFIHLKSDFSIFSFLFLFFIHTFFSILSPFFDFISFSNLSLFPLFHSL